MKGKRNLFISLACTAFLAVLSSCKEEVQNTYSDYHAYFVCQNVNTVPPLNAALNSLGVFCTIRYDRSRFLFTDETGHSTPVNATAIAGNSSLQMGIAGFIVGLPSIPELGSSISVTVCYDLACPNCYSAYNISRSLQLEEGGYAACASCGRTYSLNNQGQISAGDGGISLFRYRVSYSGNVMVINN